MDLSVGDWGAWAGVVCLAAMVRGFSGFALSALLAIAVTLWRVPIEVLPVNVLLEGIASIVLRRSTQAHADRPVAFGLLLGTVPATFVGLQLVKLLPADSLRILIAALVLVACAALFANYRPPFARWRHAPVLGGLVAGIGMGIGTLGGLYSALFMLSRNDSAERIRATLVFYLSMTAITSLLLQILVGIMTFEAVLRALSFVPCLLLGLYFGRAMFNPARQALYRQVCLGLLCSLGIASIVRVMLS